jgi:hypothetical protein
MAVFFFGTFVPPSARPAKLGVDKAAPRFASTIEQFCLP